MNVLSAGIEWVGGPPELDARQPRQHHENPLGAT
jgi:hypothetical protein